MESTLHGWFGALLGAAGVTTGFDAVRIGGVPGVPEDDPWGGRRLADSVEMAADAGLLRVDHAIHVRCEVSSQYCLDAFDGFADDPHVGLVSLMDHTPGQRQFANLEAFKRYFIGKGRTTEAEFASFVAPLIEQAELTWCGYGRTTCQPPMTTRTGSACRSSAPCTGRGHGSRDRADRDHDPRTGLECQRVLADWEDGR